MSKKQGYVTALYERLSRDDEQFGDSISIVNQKNMLENYAKENGFTNIQHYTDDGYSGGSFERPGWKKMIEDIEDGKISTVIAKDMSRIGRNYLEVGYFTEIYFSQHNIHFIAISNNVDSNNKSSSEFAPFLNIMNEWYLKDCSNKIKASKRSLGNSGGHLAALPPLGYRKDPNDKHKWLVDEKGAEIVRMIFDMCIQGKGLNQIASILEEKEIPTPAYYAALNGEGRYRYNISALNPYHWNGASVRAVLTRLEYLGYTVNFKTSSKSYKEHKNIVNDVDKWAVFENTQEPIIDLYTYQLAQKLIGTPRRVDTLGEANPLTGLVFCADCGAKMYNNRAKPVVTRFGEKRPGHDGYDCSAYKLASKRGSIVCSSHYISTKALREVILYTIQCVSKLAIEDRNEFIRKVKRETEVRSVNDAKDGKRKYNENKKRYQELEVLYKRLYESFATGLISEEKFRSLSSDYEIEQNKLKDAMTAYESAQSEKKQTDNDIANFCALVDKYTSFDELTTVMLNEFIDKVVVHKAEKIDGQRIQKVDVYLNFIGQIDFPPPPEKEVSPEQAEKDKYWKDRYNRSKDYESNRRKKIQTEKNDRLEKALEAERLKIIDDFAVEAQEVGLENMPIFPARLKSGADARCEKKLYHPRKKEIV